MRVFTECAMPSVKNGKYVITKNVESSFENTTKTLPQQIRIKCEPNFVSNPAYRVANCMLNGIFSPVIKECTKGFVFSCFM